MDENTEEYVGGHLHTISVSMVMLGRCVGYSCPVGLWLPCLKKKKIRYRQ